MLKFPYSDTKITQNTIYPITVEQQINQTTDTDPKFNPPTTYYCIVWYARWYVDCSRVVAFWKFDFFMVKLLLTRYYKCKNHSQDHHIQTVHNWIDQITDAIPLFNPPTLPQLICRMQSCRGLVFGFLDVLMVKIITTQTNNILRYC